jgi:hypothetical protein
MSWFGASVIKQLNEANPDKILKKVNIVSEHVPDTKKQNDELSI